MERTQIFDLMGATALMLADLGVTKSHSRPYTSNDNRFSEAHSKTLIYQPQFPQRFGCIEDAKTFCRSFFDWHNHDHHQTGIGLMTPDQVHYGQADEVYAARQKILECAFHSNPEHFVKKAAGTAVQTDRRLDQPANPKARAPSLNSKVGCLKVVDTFGRRHELMQDAAHLRASTVTMIQKSSVLQPAKSVSRVRRTGSYLTRQAPSLEGARSHPAPSHNRIEGHPYQNPIEVAPPPEAFIKASLRHGSRCARRQKPNDHRLARTTKPTSHIRKVNGEQPRASSIIHDPSK